MAERGPAVSKHDITEQGFAPRETVYWNLPRAGLIEEAIRRGEGRLASEGPLVVSTGKHTGRSPKDKAIVEEPGSKNHVAWGSSNLPISAEKFDALYDRVVEYLNDRDIFVRDCFVGADSTYRLPVRVISEYAWHSLFAQNLFRVPEISELANNNPEFTVIDAANFKADPERDGTRSSTFILLNFARRVVLIGGTEYAGEIKKSVFTLMNYLLPLKGVLSMHCSANIGDDGSTALFFGLSGTGKTTLSADSSRKLIGDDEHGWSDDGVFNFEGGCYAKMINLSAKAEPEIYSTTQRFGTILENVVLDDKTQQLDLDDATLTENTRGAYPLEFIPNMTPSGTGGIPKNVIFLTADAFGVLPPAARLTADQAMYHFLLGYTAKVAGTEIGVTEPEATFSTCFGAPFMVHNPGVYAKLLGEKIRKHDVHVWLVNTGWSGGPYGVGKRMKIGYTRAMVRAILDGSLRDVAMVEDPIFGVSVPASCPDVPAEVLNPRNTWTDKDAYDETAAKLAAMFQNAFKEFADRVSPEIAAAGPKELVAR